MVEKKRASNRGKTDTIVEAEGYVQSFTEIVTMIRKARQRAFHAVNTTLIDLYWKVGEYISRKVESAKWGQQQICWSSPL